MGWLWWALAGVWLLAALVLRRQASSIPVLPASEEPADDDYVFLLGAVVRLSAPVQRAAVAHARAHDLDSLDLIPADCPALAALDVVQTAKVRDYTDNRLLAGRTAGCAVAVRRELLRRARLEAFEDGAPGRLAEAARVIKRFSRRTGVAVAPGLQTPAEFPPELDAAVFASRYGRSAQAARKLFLGRWLVVAAGLAVAPAAGAASAVAFSLQPLIAFAGLALRPRDLGRAALLRIVLEGWRLARLPMTSEGPSWRERAERLRPTYDALLAKGLETFFEPRRHDCPICGSQDLRRELETVDLYQAKPGRFTLDRCGGCRTVFQNPRLSARGLEFYYRDCYDGLGAEMAELIFATHLKVYEERARLVDGLVEPRLWLDVGAGQGHFCCAAQRVFPEAEFHGVDLGERLEEAERAGWMHASLRGLLPDVAPTVAGRYDVVSLFHSLEHVTDVRRELVAAHTALRPGGFVVIEQPDPDGLLRYLLGRYWLVWFQPQHLHLPPLETLRGELEATGFEVVAKQTDAAGLNVDFASAVILFLNRLAPRPNLPWRPKRRGEAAWRTLTFGAGSWVILAAALVDRSIGVALRATGLGRNTMRLVARRRDADERD